MAHNYGRLPAYTPEQRPRLRLGPALRLDQLTLPTVVDEISRVPSWPMYLNDQIGDCTCAAAGHMIEAWTQYGQGAAVRVSDNDVLRAYQAVSGYVPGRPDTDQGAVMQDVLDYWHRVGIGGHRILAFAELDVHNPAELKAALHLFGHVYVGLNVPASAETQFDAGQPWDVVAHDGGILGGHAVNIGLMDLSGYEPITWAKRQRMTQAFVDRYGEEAWVAVSLEWISATGGSPPGLDTAQLNAQYTALTGRPAPFPANPTPTPTPSPAAPADVALAAVAKPWVRTHHTSIAGNAKMAGALKTWMKEKGL